jgi:hypothetical protein
VQCGQTPTMTSFGNSLKILTLTSWGTTTAS